MNELALALANWLLTYLLHSTLLLGAAWLIDSFGLLRSSAAREHLWRAALVGALLTATAQSAGWVASAPRFAGLPFVPRTATVAAPPAPSAPVAESVPAPRAPATARIAAGQAEVTAIPPAPGEPPDAVPDASPIAARIAALIPAPPADWPLWLTLLWLAGAGLAALRLFALGWLARSELAGRSPADGDFATELADLCSDHRVATPALSVAPGLAGPISLPNGEIVVPPWARSTLDHRQRRALLAHELAHQVRRDPQWLVFALGLDALLWLQPLHRLARRRLASLAELEADAWAARAVDDPRALAECLAECAERLLWNRAALFGAAMATNGTHSPLVERVDRLMKGNHMHAPTVSWPFRGAVVLALAAALFLFPGCGFEMRASGANFSSHITIDDDGAMKMNVKRPGYSLYLQTDGKVTFRDDESDVATLARGSELELTEKLDGVKHEYRVKADRDGELTRTYAVDDQVRPMDAAARQWLAEALPRMLRESGFDAEARVARLLAKGGPERVLVEVELAGNDHVKGLYLGTLLATARLEPAQTARALAATAKIGSDYERRQALAKAMQTQSLDGRLFTQLLEVASGLESDYELAELLTAAMERMPDDAGARKAWLAAVPGLESSYELGRTVQAGLAKHEGDTAFVAAVLALAADRLDSDYELGVILQKVAPVAKDPALAAAYLRAAGTVDSDYERKNAIVALVESAELDQANLTTVLDLTAELGSDFEKRTVLEVLAPGVASDPALVRRYREVARDLGDYERGAALSALDDAMQL